MHCPLLFCVCMHMCLHRCVCVYVYVYVYVYVHTHTFHLTLNTEHCLIFQAIFSSKTRHVHTHAHAGVAFYLRSQSKPGGSVFCSGKPMLGAPNMCLSRKSSAYRVLSLQLFNIKHRTRQEYQLLKCFYSIFLAREPC